MKNWEEPILSEREEEELRILSPDFDLRRPNGYFVSPDGTERFTWREGGEWNPPCALSQRHCRAGARNIYLAFKCAHEMEKRHPRAFSFWCFSFYEIYSCMLDRILILTEMDDHKTWYLPRPDLEYASDAKKMMIFENEFWRMCGRGFSMPYFKTEEIPVSQLPSKERFDIGRMMYGQDYQG